MSPMSPMSPKSTASSSMDLSSEGSDQQAEIVQASVDLAYKSFAYQKAAVVKSSLTYVHKAFQSLKNHPEESKNRKLRMDIVFKKNVVDVPGAQQIMECAGFKVVVEKDKTGKELKYLEVDKASVNIKLINTVSDVIQKKLMDIDKPRSEESKVPKKQVNCAGGCGFWGDENMENLCSVCHKKKYFGIKPEAQQAKKPAVECTKGCGFFGLEQFKGMCSSCFKKSGEKPITLPKSRKAKLKSAKIKLSAVRRFQLIVKRPEQKNKNRCYSCNKKNWNNRNTGDRV